MNLAHLFEVQRELDRHIVEKKGLEGQDLLPKKILSLQVELGELANEWRGFKFWSHDQEPRIKSICTFCKGQCFTDHLEDWLDSESHYTKECEFCDGTGYEEQKNPLLEEFVDCLHFILSIGLEIDYKKEPTRIVHKYYKIQQFNKMFYLIGKFNEFYIRYGKGCGLYDMFDDLFGHFLGIGEMLGFTWDEIEQSYLAKNKINHARQESGY